MVSGILCSGIKGMTGWVGAHRAAHRGECALVGGVNDGLAIAGGCANLLCARCVGVQGSVGGQRSCSQTCSTCHAQRLPLAELADRCSSCLESQMQGCAIVQLMWLEMMGNAQAARAPGCRTHDMTWHILL